MNIVHLVASPFFGGPERQILGLSRGLPKPCHTVLISFSEGGLCQPFLNEAKRIGIETRKLVQIRLHAVVHELAEHLRQIKADVLCCHGYKPDIIGWMAALRTKVPAIAVSRGWTAATFKVKLNETLDRIVLHKMIRVVCVSEGQAARVRCAGIPKNRVVVIRNAIQSERFVNTNPSAHNMLKSLLPMQPSQIVVAAGRLSPEKGFNILVSAASIVARNNPDVGFVLFGDGPLHQELSRQISAAKINDRFLLAGFRNDLDEFIPHADLVVIPSFTEGLPNVALEACAASVPVVATAVGGTPEIIEDRVNGYLVQPGDPAALAQRISDMLNSEEQRRTMGERGRSKIIKEFTFEAQCLRYLQLFQEIA
jgi:glycosyltransferase involved in cell wall biosynthesis